MVARSIANRPYLIASQHRVSVAASEQLIPRQTNETETTLTPLSESSNRYGEKYYFKTPTRYHPDAIHPAQQGQSQRDLNLDISMYIVVGAENLAISRTIAPTNLCPRTGRQLFANQYWLREGKSNGPNREEKYQCDPHPPTSLR